MNEERTLRKLHPFSVNVSTESPWRAGAVPGCVVFKDKTMRHSTRAKNNASTAMRECTRDKITLENKLIEIGGAGLVLLHVYKKIS